MTVPPMARPGGGLNATMVDTPVVFDFSGSAGTTAACHHANNGPSPGLRLEAVGVAVAMDC